jgi:hypothetical protein
MSFRTPFPRILLALGGLLLLGQACKPADQEAPQISIKRGLPAFVLLGDSLPEAILDVVDNRDCDLTAALVQEGLVDTKRYGDYRVDFRVSDQAGNESSTGFDVRVGLQKQSYYAVEYQAVDTCDSGVFNYLAGIQDCVCPDSKALLFNLGNFGPGSYVNLFVEGDYGQELRVERSTTTLEWSGNGQTVPTGDTLYLNWSVNNGAITETCRTRLVRR